MSETDSSSPKGTPEDIQIPSYHNEFVKLRALGSEGNEIVFRVRQTMELGKLKQLYSERVGIHLSILRFLFEGRRIKDTDTPQKFRMVDGDVIEVYCERTGGSF